MLSRLRNFKLTHYQSLRNGQTKSVLLILIVCILIISLAGCSLLPHSTIAVPNTSTTTYTTNTTLPSNGSLNVYFIDVGQGDSILIDQGQTEVLIDGGSQSPGVVNFLKNYVDGDLEVVVATHPHADHIGGLIAVLDAFKVSRKVDDELRMTLAVEGVKGKRLMLK